MKPFLGTDLTADKSNEEPNGAEFIVATPSPFTAQSLEQSSESAEEILEQAKLPLPLRIVQWACGITGLIVASGILKSLGGEDGVSLARAYENAAWLFWLCGICLLAWGILAFISHKNEKAVLQTDESTNAFADLDGFCDAVYSELAVPHDAKEVDVLSFYYREKDGKIKVCEKGMQMATYLNPVFRAYTDSQNLYLADLGGKYALPLSSLSAIHTVNKRISIVGWNKDEACNKGIYKQYKLTCDDYGRVHCKYYHILEFNHGGEIWGIYFPCYDLPIFEELTGLKAEQR